MQASAGTPPQSSRSFHDITKPKTSIVRPRKSHHARLTRPRIGKNAKNLFPPVTDGSSDPVRGSERITSVKNAESSRPPERAIMFVVAHEQSRLRYIYVLPYDKVPDGIRQFVAMFDTGCDSYVPRLDSLKGSDLHDHYINMLEMMLYGEDSVRQNCPDDDITPSLPGVELWSEKFGFPGDYVDEYLQAFSTDDFHFDWSRYVFERPPVFYSFSSM